MLYLVCYDIVDDRRRNKVANLLKGYGLRVQKSVFECVFNDDQYAWMQKRLSQYLNADEDQLRFYPMSVRSRRQVLILGQQPHHAVDDATFII